MEGRGLAWLLLILAGLLEVGWAIGLKYTDGFTRLVPSVLTVLAIAASMVLLSLAARVLPIGTAYAVWVGIGAVGAAVLGIVLFDEPRNAGRLFFLGLLVVSIVGLRMTTGEAAGVVGVETGGPGRAGEASDG
jgi:quaternary ammonium compound-resistance protein SugE